MTRNSDFNKQMKDVDWTEVFDRQAARGDLTPTLLEILSLNPGDAILEIGCGPGYTTIQLANRVKPGSVYAVDRNHSALQYCRKHLKSHHLTNVQLLVMDAETLGIRFSNPIRVLAAFVLHHTPHPYQLLNEISNAIPATSHLLVTEYDPQSQGDVGPPIDSRINQSTVIHWLEDTGFRVHDTYSHPEEKYSILVRKP